MVPAKNLAALPRSGECLAVREGVLTPLCLGGRAGSRSGSNLTRTVPVSNLIRGALSSALLYENKYLGDPDGDG